MQSYSQRDPLWAAQKMGPSNQTLGRSGCTTSCIADLSTYFGDNLNPSQVCGHIAYTTDGLIMWGSVNFPHFKFDRREFGRNDANIKAALADPNRAVILNVSGGSHWVVATGVNWLTRKYNIADPWFGDKTTMSRYGDSISGAAYFIRY